MKKIPPFIKNKKIYLGGRKKQRGRFLFGANLLLPIVAKLLTGRGRKKRKRRRRW